MAEWKTLRTPPGHCQSAYYEVVDRKEAEEQLANKDKEILHLKAEVERLLKKLIEERAIILYAEKRKKGEFRDMGECKKMAKSQIEAELDRGREKADAQRSVKEGMVDPVPTPPPSSAPETRGATVWGPPTTDPYTGRLVRYGASNTTGYDAPKPKDVDQRCGNCGGSTEDCDRDTTRPLGNQTFVCKNWKPKPKEAK